MLEDYCNKLQTLSKQKSKFLKLKYKENAKSALQKQQNKYHKYILSQISHKNKLDSLFKVTHLISSITLKQKMSIFNKIFKHQKWQKDNKVQIVSEKQIIQNKGNQSQIHSETNLKSHLIKLKLKLKAVSCGLMFKFIEKKQTEIQKQVLKCIQKRKNQFNSFQNISKLLQKKQGFQKNVFIENLKNLKFNKIQTISAPNAQNKSFILSLNQFSQIFPYTIQQASQELSTSRIKNIEQIDSKFRPLSFSKLETSQVNQNKLDEYQMMFQSLQKLKEQVFIMRNLLSQKNRQIKAKDQQICKIKKECQRKVQSLHDQMLEKIEKAYINQDKMYSSTIRKTGIQKSSQYLKQLQNHIIGDRSPRNYESQQDPVNQQLLQKYMKQSFEMRQKMDMARQMCQQFQFDSRTQEGQIMLQIIKFLTPQERLNAFVD